MVLRVRDLPAGAAIVTGAGRGIGRAIATRLARERMPVSLVGRTREALEEVALEIGATGGLADVVCADVREVESSEAIVSATCRRFGAVAVLVNCAGVPGEGRMLEDVDDALWAEVIDTNLGASFRLMRSVLPLMRAQGHGHVVNVASVVSERPGKCMAAYVASKAGIVALTRAVAKDYGPFGIRCNCVSPGLTATRMTQHTLSVLAGHKAAGESVALGGPAEAKDVASAVVYLCSEDARFVTGTVLTVDGWQMLR